MLLTLYFQASPGLQKLEIKLLPSLELVAEKSSERWRLYRSQDGAIAKKAL